MEAIEEKSLDMLDNTDFQETDIPAEVPLPEQAHLTVSIHCLLTKLIVCYILDSLKLIFVEFEIRE